MDLEQLRERVRRGERFSYRCFWGHRESEPHRWLSQWFPSPFVAGGVRYATAEHWMMAEKARLFGDDEMCARILESRHPSQAKKLGGRVRGFDEARWQAHRFEIVVQGNLHKFRQLEELGAQLRATDPSILVESSPTDAIWGIGLAQEDPDAQDPLRWRGLNLLGFALMEVRERL